MLEDAFGGSFIEKVTLTPWVFLIDEDWTFVCFRREWRTECQLQVASRKLQVASYRGRVGPKYAESAKEGKKARAKKERSKEAKRQSTGEEGDTIGKCLRPPRVKSPDVFSILSAQWVRLTPEWIFVPSEWPVLPLTPSHLFLLLSMSIHSEEWTTGRTNIEQWTELTLNTVKSEHTFSLTTTTSTVTTARAVVSVPLVPFASFFSHSLHILTLYAFSWTPNTRCPFLYPFMSVYFYFYFYFSIILRSQAQAATCKS